MKVLVVGAGGQLANELEARAPGDGEVVALTDTVEQLLRGLDDRDRQIVELSLQGHTAPEISKRIDRSERTIYRVLERIKGRLEAMGIGPPG